MGRARSNLKRRPFGKRGWRKIDVAEYINPTIPFSTETEKQRLEQAQDSELWRQDTTPRKHRIPTKAQKKRAAKRKLIAQGCDVDSIAAAQKLQQRMERFRKRQEQRLKKNAHQNPPNAASNGKQTVTLKFKNKTRKQMTVNTEAPSRGQQKRASKHNERKNLNPPELRLQINLNTAKSQHKDLWHDEKRKKQRNAQSSEQEADDEHEEEQQFMDVVETLKARERQSGVHLSGKRSVKNPFIGSFSLLALPKPGESINPLQHEFYYLKWKALQLELKQLFVDQYQSKKTLDWYKEVTGSDERTDERLKVLRAKANKMRLLYLKHLKLHKLRQRKLVWLKKKSTEQNMDEKKREIADTEKRNDVKWNRRSMRLRQQAIKTRMQMVQRNGGHIYGPNYRYRTRATPTMYAKNLNHSLRETVHTGIDHPLSFMFHELQRQNRVQGARRKRYTMRRKKGYFGPRFRCHTRIGKVHHANVGTSLFAGIDDVEML